MFVNGDETESYWEFDTIYIMKFKQVSILHKTHFSSTSESITPMKTDVML